MLERMSDGGSRICQRRRRPYRQWTDYALIGYVCFQSRPAIIELDAHAFHSTPALPDQESLNIIVVFHHLARDKTKDERPMSIDKSLRRKNSLERARNVLTRGERIKVLQNEERWQDGRSPFGLPKVRVVRLVVKKVKKAKEEEKPAGEVAAEGEAAAAPAAGAKAPAAKAPAGKAPAG